MNTNKRQYESPKTIGVKPEQLLDIYTYVYIYVSTQATVITFHHHMIKKGYHY